MLIYKICQNIRSRVGSCLDHCITHLIFIGNSVHFRRFYSHGIPRVLVSRGGTLVIGDDFHMNNGLAGNPIGFVQPCCFFIQPGATIKIGDHVGMSSTALVAAQSIEIGNGVKIGGGVCIYDTDFHSLNPCSRQNPELDRKEARSQNRQPCVHWRSQHDPQRSAYWRQFDCRRRIRRIEGHTSQ